MTLKKYIAEINRQYQTGIAREHSYRPALQQLLQNHKQLRLLTVTNEPARIACGAPDFVLTRNHLPVAFVEAKDIGDNDLDGQREHKEQFNRYKSSLEHILFTDYLDFHLYEKSKWIGNVRIGEIRGNKICFIQEQEDKFNALLSRFSEAELQQINSPSELAREMAAKARLLAQIIRQALRESNTSSENKQLQELLQAFKKILMPDLSPESFSDIYAQTIAYGLFAARLHDKEPHTFSRDKAANLIPKTNPFLRKIFQNIAGYELDKRIIWIVDSLASIFCASNIDDIMDKYERKKGSNDPMIHFYEDFLSAYDPNLRKSKGVWYTPQPVVKFMVHAVDTLLQQDFNLSMGLANHSAVERNYPTEASSKDNSDGNIKYAPQTFHKVQILDPAAGTGTFLAEIVHCIFNKFQEQKGMWQNYVAEHLLPRLNGFELLIASYAIAHLKLDMSLESTGYVHPEDSNKRLRVYLTNALEEYHPDTDNVFFAQWLIDEAKEANHIKRNTPVMVMIGNPPYSGESKNKGEWIMRLMETYKKEPEGKTILKERNPKWLNDDYVKFIRMAQYFIEKNGEGILAFINPHGYLDNPTFRGMRWNLLKTYDKIYTIDLHGNSKKRETTPDGHKDENVFDIQQGVSINFFIKTGRKNKDKLGKTYHYDLYGKRQDKYDFLETHTLPSIPFQELQPQAPMYFFVPKDFTIEEEYSKGFAVNELFPVSSVGIVTTKDAFLICNTKEEVKRRITDIIELPEKELKDKYGLTNTRDWSIARAKADVGNDIDERKIVPIAYRPFDTKFLYYTGKTNGIVARPRFRSSKNFLDPKNFGLITCRQLAADPWYHISITKHIAEYCRVSNKTKESGYVFPLYVSDENFGKPTRIPNLNPKIIKKIEKELGASATPIELFDYIYALLHSPAYRQRYKEFLKIDFPRIPYPSDLKKYRLLSEKGATLRQLHLMEGSDNWQTTSSYPETGTNEVTQLRYQNNKVFINETQYFSHVSETVWNFYIGGYQPAQKWLKDRKSHILSFSDIRHYQEIIVALSETNRLMRDIDLIILR